MSPEQFIKKNVIEKLLAEGFTETQAEMGGGRSRFFLSTVFKTIQPKPNHL